MTINTERKTIINQLINEYKLVEDTNSSIPRDASNRYYIRYKNNSNSYLLMVDDDIPNSVEQFAKISKHLLNLGVNSPIIFYENSNLGIMLIEDFGDNTYSKLFNENIDDEKFIIQLYKNAIDEIMKLQKNIDATAINLEPYDGGKMLNEVMLFVDWYYQYKQGEIMNDLQKHQYKKIWLEIFAKIPPYTPTLVLRDFHAGNIIKAKNKIGIIDFQDALIGAPSYDVTSLIEDSRLNISKNLKNEVYDYYKHNMGKTNMFDEEYNIIAMQRHTKVLGIFARLGMRDKKIKYFDFIPNTEKLFFEKLKLPIFEKLHQFYNKNFYK